MTMTMMMTEVAAAEGGIPTDCYC
jgi:uncharacterized integral membrane protein